jgi:hypothetical protein
VDDRDVGVAVYGQTWYAISFGMQQAVRGQVTRGRQFGPTPNRFTDKTLPGD